MAKKRRHRARRRNRHHRRVRARSRNPFFALAPRRRHRRRRNYGGRRHRRRNPSLREFTSGSMVEKIGGAAVGFFGSRMIPENVAFLAQYNTGWTGYALDLGVGLGLSWALSKFWSRSAGNYAMIGTGLAVLARIVTEKLGVATPAASASASMSGDLDYNLAYYTSDRFPFPQGAGGPYPAFVGNPALPGGMPITSASAVRAGAAAAAAVPALAAGGAAAGGDGRWGGQW